LPSSPRKTYPVTDECTGKISGKTVTRRLTHAELAEYQPLFDN
jgi:hypothetical protein